MSSQGTNVLSLRASFLINDYYGPSNLSQLHVVGPWAWHQRLHNLDVLNTMDLCLKQYFPALQYQEYFSQIGNQWWTCTHMPDV